ncbi:MAG: hypothetical protein PVG78_16320 [Desulfobacterales bacterium]|jgi:hypothetical protein
MSEINLDDGKILVEKQWLSAEQIKQQIQEKMDAGDMKFAGLAKALEELNSAMEGAHALDVRIAITKDQYEKLRSLVDGDERACLKAAVAAFIGQGSSGGKKRFIRCTNCKARIELPQGERPMEIRCPECNAVGRLKSRA